MRLTRRLVDSDDEESKLASTRRVRRTTTWIEQRGSTAQQVGVQRQEFDERAKYADSRLVSSTAVLVGQGDQEIDTRTTEAVRFALPERVPQSHSTPPASQSTALNFQP